MAKFRSDCNIVPNTYTWTSLKKYLTTCFQNWHQEPLIRAAKVTGFLQKQQYSTVHFSTHFKGNNGSFVGRASQVDKFGKVKSFTKDLLSWANSKIQAKQTAAKKEPPRRDFAKLLSSTLIDSTITLTNLHCENSHLSFGSKMTIIDSDYWAVREENPDIDKEIRSILVLHAKDGITIANIKKEYRKITGNPFPLHDNITDFLLTIPQVTAECNENGTRIFNIKPNNKNKHIHDMILHQRQRSDFSQSSGTGSLLLSQGQAPRNWQYNRQAMYESDNNFNLICKEQPGQQFKSQLLALANAATVPLQISDAITQHNWCYQDNWNHLNNHYQQSTVSPVTIDPVYYIPTDQHREEHSDQAPALQHQQRRQEKRCRDVSPYTMSSNTRTSPSQNSVITIRSDIDAYLLDFPLMGDDFFLYLARMELKCKFKKYEKILQSGLCVSGQTISAARRRLRQVDLYESTQIIVNIGSVDIMRGKPLVQIEHDFRQLLNDMHDRRFVPILTTIAPLANYRHDKDTCEKVARFNKFIKTEGRGLCIIDIHSCLVNENGVVLFDCFQNAPRSVTGSTEPHVFWNKIGRQRVLQMIEANLEY